MKKLSVGVIRASVLIAMAALMQSCTLLSHLQHFRLYAAPPDGLKPVADDVVPSRGIPGKHDFALALSGGGSRGGYYSIGVLKALYDRGYLPELDSVSSVSGGGYALFWLISQSQMQYASGDKADHISFQPRFDMRTMSEASNAPLGENMFSDGVWARRNSYLQLKGHVVHPVRALYLYGKHDTALRESYANDLDRFARCTEELMSRCPPVESSPQLMDYQDAVRSGRLPFFRFNFTVSTKSKDQYSGLVEASAFRFGNEPFGYHGWLKTDDMPMKKAVGISGAAAPFILPYQLPDFLYGRDDPEAGFTAYDGAGAELEGQGEKLGALPLLEAGFENVVIVDTELDPDFNFKAYVNLKKLAEQRGIEFSVPVIDAYLRREQQRPRQPWYHLRETILVAEFPPVMTGKATGMAGHAPLNVEIRYIKMSLSKDLVVYDKARAKGGKFCVRGADFAAFDARNEIDRPKVGGRRVLKRENVDMLPNLHLGAGHYAAAIADYANHLDRTMIHYKLNIPALESLGEYASLHFPMLSTFDQYFSPSAAEALIGLGYLQGIQVNLPFGRSADTSQNQMPMSCRENSPLSEPAFLPQT